MRTLELSVGIVAIIAIGCRPHRLVEQRPVERRSQMMFDSSVVSGKNVIIVRPQEAVRPTESVIDLKELPTFMQLDIEAPQRAPSREVIYVRPGEAIRPAEPTP